MRPKFVLLVLGFAIVILGVVALVERGIGPRADGPIASRGEVSVPERAGASRATADIELPEPDSAGRRKPRIPAPFLGTSEPSGNGFQASVPVDPAHEEYVRNRIAELARLARNTDPGSLNTIMSELQNPDKEIRKGALAATLQFRDRASIPRLQAIADSTEDLNEKGEILKAIEYLGLPTLTERLAEAQATASGTSKPLEKSLSPSSR